MAYCDLIPMHTHAPASASAIVRPAFQIERIVRSERVRPGSLREGLSDTELREGNDFLEWCLLNVLKTLQANQSRPIHLYVDGVIADVDGSEVVKHAEEGGFKRKMAEAVASQKVLDAKMQTAADGFSLPQQLLVFLVEQLTRTEEQLKHEKYEEDVKNDLRLRIRELSQEIAELRALIDREKPLTSEIRSLLNRAGIAQVERSDRAGTSSSTRSMVRRGSGPAPTRPSRRSWWRPRTCS